MADVQLQGAQIQGIFREKFAEKRKKLLLKALNLEEFEEDDDLRSAIVLDIYHDALSYAVNEGLPWAQVAMFFQIFKNTLTYLSETTLPRAIEHFRQDMEKYSQFYTEAGLNSLVDYVFMTLFQHYKLHRYVLTCDRIENRTKCTVIVESPVELPDLSEAIPEIKWNEKQKLKEIDEMEERQKLARHIHYQQLLEEAMKHLEIPFEELEADKQIVNKEALTNIVKNVAAAQANVTETSLQEAMEQIKDTLEFQHMRANVLAEFESVDSKAARRKSNASSSKGKKK